MLKIETWRVIDVALRSFAVFLVNEMLPLILADVKLD
jgi:hypothetical protein